MDNVGGGYYAEYSYRKRPKSKLYKLEQLSPLIGSYVRTEDAFKVPTDASGRVSPFFEQYNLVDYEGPSAIPVNQNILQTDLELYGMLKGQLLKNAAIAGLIGTVVANLVGGLNDAVIYFIGAIAGVGYLFFLSIKTDTLGSPGAKFGANVANLRFALPLIVLLGVALQNLASGGVDSTMDNLFNSVTRDQFAAAMCGFLTYRIPLFISQLGPIIGETAGMTLPGSAGIAMEMAKEAKQAKQSSTENKSSIFMQDLATVLVVSGPAGTGKSELVDKLIEDSGGKLIAPAYLDRVANPIMFEQLENRNEILQVDITGRYGLTKSSLLDAAGKYMNENGEEMDQVVVIDANVELSKKLTNLGGIRLVGVWVALDELDKFELGLKKQVESGKIPVPEGETPDSVRRAKIREIVKDIEYGVVSGIFEFTVLNDDFDDSLLQLKNAAEYCFK